MSRVILLLLHEGTDTFTVDLSCQKDNFSFGELLGDKSYFGELLGGIIGWGQVLPAIRAVCRVRAKRERLIFVYYSIFGDI